MLKKLKDTKISTKDSKYAKNPHHSLENFLKSAFETIKLPIMYRKK